MEKDRNAAFAAKRDIDIYVNAAFAALRGERVNISEHIKLGESQSSPKKLALYISINNRTGRKPRNA
jgi:hypothetical protein